MFNSFLKTSLGRIEPLKFIIGWVKICPNLSKSSGISEADLDIVRLMRLVRL